VATPDQLRARITARPFVPFMIKLNGGQVYTVRHPENAACDLRGRALTGHDENGMHLVEMLHVEVMAPVASTPSSDGNGP
jgi:hypothetical protein